MMVAAALCELRMVESSVSQKCVVRDQSAESPGLDWWTHCSTAGTAGVTRLLLLVSRCHAATLSDHHQLLEQTSQ